MKKFLCIVLSLVMLLIVFPGCAPNNIPDATPGVENTETSKPDENENIETPKTEENDNSPESSYPVEIIDSMGRKVTISEKPEKIVSGYYISTYMLINLGLKDKIVGIESKANSRPVYKNFAPELLEVPDVGTAKAVNQETILSLNPDLIVLPYQQAETASVFENLNIPTIVVKPETMDDFLYVLDILGKATGHSDSLTGLIEWYESAWADLETKTENLDKKTVYISSSSDALNALSPKMFQADMIKAAGGKLVTDDLNESYWSKISLEQLYIYKPEFMFISSGSDITPQDLLSDENWANIFVNENIFNLPCDLDGWDSPGLSSVLGAYFIASKLHPDVVTAEDVMNLAEEYYKIAFDADVTIEQLGL